MEESSRKDFGYLFGGNVISELRRHYFLDDYCIIATERNKRPSDFIKLKQTHKSSQACPFCPGNELMTPPAIAVYTDQGKFSDGIVRIMDWKIRVFPNLYSAVSPISKKPIEEWFALPGYGYHEVIVDTPNHSDSPADFSTKHMKLVLDFYRERYINYRNEKDIYYISIFKNYGEAAGASLAHSHSQLVALSLIPPLITRELSAISSSASCPYCDIVEYEKASRRLIDQNENWIMISPFCSKAPYEIWILPKGHMPDLSYLNDNQLDDLASILIDALRNLRSLLEDPPYNYMLFQLQPNYHFNIRIQPVLAKIAGFEKGTNIYINPIPPEQAASELRNV
jgi:UDPglucose--hexose-1-phosphate uridylyltransferase